MKLYNIFKEVIFEEIGNARSVLTEGVSEQAIIDCINGKYNVNIQYRDYKDKPPSKRYIQVYNFSITKGGNKAIRAYQIFGGSKTTPKTGAWKIFRLDRIEGWYPTNVKWYSPVSDYSVDIPSYNQLGDKSMATVIDLVAPDTFIRQRSDIGQNPNNNL